MSQSYHLFLKVRNEASLVYRVVYRASSTTARATQRKSASKYQKKKRKKTNTIFISMKKVTSH